MKPKKTLRWIFWILLFDVLIIPLFIMRIAKIAILRECGITVADSPADVGKLMAEKMEVIV